MTRINVVPVEDLHDMHLRGEYKEITRVFTLSKNAKPTVLKRIPKEYVLGKGHVTFFYDKLLWVGDRYEQLTEEMINRGYSPKPVPTFELLEGVDESLLGWYDPTPEAIKLNWGRINERLKGMGELE